GSDIVRMAVSNSQDFAYASQEPYQPTRQWDLCSQAGGFIPLSVCPDGTYTVYVKFYSQGGHASPVVSDSIVYRTTPPEKVLEVLRPFLPPALPLRPSIPVPPTEGQPILKQITEVLKPLIPEFLMPKEPEEIPQPAIPVEELVLKETPLAMQGIWKLLSTRALEAFVLAPLPREIRVLTQKFEGLKRTFEEVGIRKITDVRKLQTAEVKLPGLTEALGLPATPIKPGTLALPKGIPVADLAPGAKQQIPSEIIFARSGGQLIDFKMALTITEEGRPKQKISTISGKPLQLVVKPDQPAKSVRGYLVFRERAPRAAELEMPLASLAASPLFAFPVFAQPVEQPVPVKEEFVLLEFEYEDPDGDGIWTADIQAPLTEGEYEVITIIEYEDPELGRRAIRLTTVVDPEGYVFEQIGNQELRITGAIVSLYRLNPLSTQYELWPAGEYQQENPQVTDVTGRYSYLVPEGTYYLQVEAPGYRVHIGKPFRVSEGSGVHENIELTSGLRWLDMLDWKTVLLALVALLLGYNFYKDRLRKKLQA
ncbi:MAG: carboxypeptidase-like regulatory domain-containing protein, partial [Patescibacteria group bacterium]